MNNERVEVKNQHVRILKARNGIFDALCAQDQRSVW